MKNYASNMVPNLKFFLANVLMRSLIIIIITIVFIIIINVFGLLTLVSLAVSCACILE